MLRSNKAKAVSSLQEIYEKSELLIITHYHGLSVADITHLRRNLRVNGGKLKIIKNTLAQIANSRLTKKSDFSYMFNGPTAIVYSDNDPISVLKDVVDFANKNTALKIVGGVLNDEIFDTKSILLLASIPSISELRRRIVSILRQPASRLISVLGGPATKLTMVHRAYIDKI